MTQLNNQENSLPLLNESCELIQTQISIPTTISTPHLQKNIMKTASYISQKTIIATAVSIAFSSFGIYINQSYAQDISAGMTQNLGNQLLSVDVFDKGGNQQIKLSLSGLANKPQIINFRDRVIVEFDNTTLNTAQLPLFNNALIKDIRFVSQGNKMRVTILTNQPVKANLENTNLQDRVWVVGLAAKPPETIATSPLLASDTGAKADNQLQYIKNPNPFASVGIFNHELQNIDFQRSANGGGRLTINLNHADTPVDIRSQGSNLVVDFYKTQVPSQLKRNYNVMDFATPVREMSLTNQGGLARLNIKTQGVWTHKTYQTDGKLVIEINPVQSKKIQAGADYTKDSKKYSGNPISLNFQDIEVRALMQVFADFTSLNIAVNDNVQGNLTVRLKDIPWDQAFDIVMETKNLGYKRNGKVIWVAPKDELIAKEKQALEAKNQLQELEPLKTQNIQLSYHKANTVAKALLGEGDASKSTPIISKRGSLTYDTRTNQLFITDTADKLEEIDQLVRKIDVPVRQVMVEARIVEADDKFGKSLGVKLGGWGKPIQYKDPVTGNTTLRGGAISARISGSQDGVTSASGFTDDSIQITNANSNFVSLPAASVLGAKAASLGISLFSKSLSGLLNLELSALEGDGRGKIVSSPKVVTTDKQKALIEQGTEIPYQAATSSGATSVEFKKANLKLEVTPQITPEGKVFLDVDINKDTPSVVVNGAAGLAIDTKHVQTQVLVENGGTVMIGGIFQEEERSTISKVPVLGDIPYLGRLFKSTSQNKNRTELIIFLTPKVIEDAIINNNNK